jgi:hypothetical protein
VRRFESCRGRSPILWIAAQLAAIVGTPALPRELTELTGRHSRLGVTASQLQQALHNQPTGRQRAALDALTSLIEHTQA